MKLLKKLSRKKILNEYCDLYSEWFNVEKLQVIDFSTKSLIGLIEKQYSNMSKEEINKELIALKERINITKSSHKYNVEYCFYNLCLDVLNQYLNSDAKSKEVNNYENKDEGFLVELANWIFGTLEKISIFNLIRKLKNDTSHKFVDLWVIGNLAAAIISSIFVYNLSIENKFIIYIILLYSFLRVFEVIIYQINVLLFHPYRRKKAGKEYKIKSVTRMVIALLNNYVEIMFWYSTMVISIIILNEGNVYKLPWTSYIKSNVLCIATLDANTVKEAVKTSYKYLTNLVFVEIISGIIMTVISLARFIGALPGIEDME